MEIEILYAILICTHFLLVQGLGSEFSHKNGTTGYARRILYGEAADPKDFSYMARMHPLDEDVCGGSIISKNFILTAGHCVWDVVCTDIKIFPSTWKEGDEPSIHAESCYPHHNYVGRGYSCDIALIKTVEDLVADLNLVPITLPSSSTKYPDGTSVVIAGWGFTEDGDTPTYLKRGDMVIQKWEDCNHNYQNAYECTYNGQCPVPKIPYRSECVIGEGDHGVGTCFGDSGGPVVKDGLILGVMVGTILVDGKCSNEYPTLYMDVARFLRWIRPYLEYNGGTEPVDEENC